MPPPSNKHANILRDVVPKNHLIFNPWNSASTGHQRAESSYSSTSEWRTTRTEKLSYQFGKPMTNGSGDGTLDGGAQGRGEWRWMTADEAERRRLGCGDIRTLMGGVKKRKAEGDGDGDDRNGNWNGRKRLELGASSSRSLESVPSSAQAQVQDSSLSSSSAPQHGRTQSLPHSRPQPPLQSKEYKPRPRAKLAFCSSKTNPNPNSEPTTEKEEEGPSNPPGIFTGTTIFINGSTFPLISDHKLKHLLASNGANIAILLDHKTVTHVVMGKPNGNGPGGSGGGLAAAKLQKELQRRGSKSVRFVGVEWVLESLKVSKRLPESGFSNFNMVSKSQQSVLNMFKKSSS